jgi:TPR repeat protein
LFVSFSDFCNEGVGVDRDEKKALNLFRRAADELKDEESVNWLCDYYEKQKEYDKLFVYAKMLSEEMKQHRKLIRCFTKV